MRLRKRKGAKHGAAVVVGAAAGLATGGPIGLAIGAAAPLVQLGLSEVAQRALSSWERERVMSALEHAAARVQERLDAGEVPRSDIEDEEGQKRGRRLVDNVLIATQQDFDERKAALYGRLLANLLFEPNLDFRTAHTLTRLGSELTYTQLGLLALVGSNRPERLPDTHEAFDGGASWEAATIRRELDNLGYAQRELVANRRENRMLPTNIGQPSTLLLNPLAEALHGLMELERFDPAELDALATALRIYAYGPSGAPEGPSTASEEPAEDPPE